MKAFIFDLDGIIVDTAKYHFNSWKIIAKKIGFGLSKTHKELLKGVSREESLDKILNWGDFSIEIFEKKKYLKEKNELYKGFICNLNKMDVLPGVHRLIDFARIKEIPIALGSASKNAHQILEKLEIHDNFIPIISEYNCSFQKIIQINSKIDVFVIHGFNVVEFACGSGKRAQK